MRQQIIMEVKNLTKYYPELNNRLFTKKSYVHAVDGISLAIQEGETLGIVGESGCGKSTFGRQLVALEKPTSGEVYYEDHEISSLPARQLGRIRTQIQMVFQDPNSSLNPRKNIYDILSEPMLYHHIVTKEDLNNKITELLHMVGLSSSSKYKYPHEFSGGQRQRIGIAKALSLNPKLIVCDEPVSALDVSVQAQVLNLLRELQEQFHLTYVFIGHGLGAVHYISDRIAVMYLGKIVEIADSDELFTNPRHPYTQALLDASPIPDPGKRDRERIVLPGEAGMKLPEEGCSFYPRCIYATELCRSTQPSLTSISDQNQMHRTACFMQNQTKEGKPDA